MTKSIAVFFDGTWNVPGEAGEPTGDQTNVWKLHEAVLDSNSGAPDQIKAYQPGVGTNWYDRLSGGIFGVGLSEKIMAGYAYLVKNYEPGDKIFVFGFSRGAYTARSLVGLIRNSGLLKKKNAKYVEQAYSLYRTRDKAVDGENAKFFRDSFCYDGVEVECLGVWDTVGALGIPVESFDWFNKDFYQFHDTTLSGIVHNAFHAIAIDEHRKNYAPTLWDSQPKSGQRVEQVWFVGAHSNVGGGYKNNALSDVALIWMAARAQECGLKVDPTKLPSTASASDSLIDSYKEFLKGAYARVEARYLRPIGSTKFGFEDVDPSVGARLKGDAAYRPKNTIGSNLKGGWPQR